MTTPISAPDPRRWLALFLLCTAQFLVILDTSIVGIALPALQRALGFDAAGLQWIFNAYVVAFGGLLLLGGRLADLFGPRRLFGLGFVVLTVSSLVAGLAQSAPTLLVARGLQGAGAALIAPAALSMVMARFAARPTELRKALGFWGASAAAGGTAGVFLGGVITEWLSWRWTFLINVPIGVLVLVATTAWLPRGQRRPGSVDVAGSLAVTSALGLAVYAIVTANQPAATAARTALLLAISAALFVAFVLIQRARREPLIPPAILRAPNLAVGNVVMALLGAAWIPMWFFLNMYLQAVLGYGAFASGLALLPMTLTIMVLMIAATERIVGRIGPKAALVIGLGTLGLALVLFAHMPIGGSFAVDVLVPSLLGAAGMSLAYIPAMITATAGARPEDGGLASGLVNTTYQVGSAIGLAAMVAVASGGATLHAGFSAAFVGAAAIAVAAAVIAAVAIRMPRAVPAAAAAAEPAEGRSARAARCGRASFRFVFRGVAFTFVDSGAAGLDPIIEARLDDWLAAAADRVHAFLTHFPPIDPVGTRYGSFRSRRDAHRLLAKLAAAARRLTGAPRAHRRSARSRHDGTLCRSVTDVWRSASIVPARGAAAYRSAGRRGAADRGLRRRETCA